MIVGIFLRNFKTYKSINYIPITDQDRFCGLIGNNGIGKSSVLESLDCFFNEKPWNLHTATKNNVATSNPQIVPVFLIPKAELAADIYEAAEILSEFAKKITDEEVPLAYQPHIKSFISHRSRLAVNFNLDEFFLLPIGIGYNSEISVSVFNTKLLIDKFTDNSNTEESGNELKKLSPVLDALRNSIEYIYIPREIDPKLFTKLETNEIQILMGETLNEIISDKVKSQVISDINTGLTSFIDKLSNELEIYSYRTPDLPPIPVPV